MTSNTDFLAHFEEKTVSVEPIYSGAILQVEKMTVKLPNGNLATRDIVRHNGASAVVAITDTGRYILVRQFRKPCEMVSIELPAGKLEKGEDPMECAVRELEEETGYRAGTIRPLLKMYSTPGFSDELLHLFVATNLVHGQANPDDDEFIAHFEMSSEEVLAAIQSGEINDGKTIAGILATMQFK